MALQREGYGSALARVKCHELLVGCSAAADLNPLGRMPHPFGDRRRPGVLEFMAHGIGDENPSIEKVEYVDFLDEDQLVQRRSVSDDDHSRGSAVG